MEQAIINLFGLIDGEEARMVAATSRAVYFVTNLGRVFSVRAHSKKREYSKTRIRSGSAYLSVMIGRKRVSIHRLVATAFIPNPDKKPQINHIDGNKFNNRVDNLEWCTQSENVKHAFKAGLNKPSHKTIRDEDKLRAVFDDVFYNRLSYMDASIKHDIPYSTIAVSILRERKGDRTFLRDMYPNLDELLGNMKPRGRRYKSIYGKKSSISNADGEQDNIVE